MPTNPVGVGRGMDLSPCKQLRALRRFQKGSIACRVLEGDNSPSKGESRAMQYDVPSLLCLRESLGSTQSRPHKVWYRRSPNIAAGFSQFSSHCLGL
jgi:hypothetical protein